MKALVLEKCNELLYKYAPEPEISDQDVMVQVKACGICGSDVHDMDGSTGRRIPPLIMGHKASGVIAKTGNNIKDWNKGDRVTIDSTVYLLKDWYTLHGLYSLSDNREVLGVSPGSYRRNGAFAEYMAVPQHILYRIPDYVSFEQAAMVEPVAIALHAVNLSGLKHGESCAVAGVGTIGIFIIQLIQLAGASQVIAVDINRMNLKHAGEMGAGYMFHPSEDDVTEKIRAITKGSGADLAFEAVGKSATVNIAIDLLAKGKCRN